MECQFCGQVLPENARFCFKCKKQIVCQKCGEKLVDGASICIYCGVEITTATNSNVQNYIRYRESQTEKMFEATFSNETAGAVVETFANFMPINKKQSALSAANNNVAETSFEEIENTEHPQLVVSTPSENNGDVLTSINQVFRKRGNGEIYLHETNLKANSKGDYAGRLTILYLYYNQVNGISEVKRSEVGKFIVKTGLSNDGNYRAWISKAKSLFSINNGSYCLCRAGEERAKEYLDDIFNQEKTDKWKLGNITKSSPKSSPHSKSPKKVGCYSIVSGLDLNPNGKESLKKFVTQYKTSNGAEYNLVFVYYLKKIIGANNICPDHIYTCYMDLKVKFPSNIRQSLVDTKNRKGWIDTSNMSNILITTMGENAILDLKK